MTEHHLYSGTLKLRKEWANSFRFSWEAPAWNLPCTNKGIRRREVCFHRYADCLLKNTSTKHNKYVVNQKREHVDDINFKELSGRIRVGFYKLSTLPMTRYVYLCWPFFYMKHSWTNSLNMSFSFEWVIVVQREGKSNVLRFCYRQKLKRNTYVYTNILYLSIHWLWEHQIYVATNDRTQDPVISR